MSAMCASLQQLFVFIKKTTLSQKNHMKQQDEIDNVYKIISKDQYPLLNHKAHLDYSQCLNIFCNFSYQLDCAFIAIVLQQHYNIIVTHTQPLIGNALRIIFASEIYLNLQMTKWTKLHLE